MVCVVGRMRDLILQLSKSSIYSTKPHKSLIKMYEYEKPYDIRCHRKIITMGYTLLKNSSVD
ncbi:hypothetical protein EAI59_21010 [Escherichia coli]